MQVRGRHLIIGWTVVFFIAIGAIMRREYGGWKIGHAVGFADDTLKQLAAEAAGVHADIAAAESRDSLVPRVQAIGLRYVSDSNLKSITIPGHR